ncbi:uncharacterized protein LOC131683908 isoform X2 [Topomyia yanbarensis]|uniref:uncharacterized protein LOC131683908 isoform X2 n=1 Tax=Topomyia yanbarensis TaxID=2498891 RepID=UPI00273C1EDF|nr:uncharacterized protein LOC131683908 isoform X2 [Topomyia yanbarensis]
MLCFAAMSTGKVNTLQVETPVSKTANSKSKRKASSLGKNEVPSKRIARSDRKKPERAIQWVHSELRQISNSVGHPVQHPMRFYTHLNLLQLPLQPGILTPETIHKHFEPPPWNTTYPVPLVTYRGVAKANAGQLMFRLVKAKKAHLTTLNSMKMNFHRKKRLLKKELRKTQNLYPNTVFKVAEQMNRDPDKWFSARFGYDYYFTSGSLAVVDCELFVWIVNTVGEELDEVEIVPAKVAGAQLELETSEMKRYELGSDQGPIFETAWHVSEGECGNNSGRQTSRSENGRMDVKIAFRRKHQIDIMWTKAGIDAMKIKSITSEVPFISCSFQHRGNGWLMFTSDLEKIIKLWDCKQGEVVGSLQLPKEDAIGDCWSCVRPIGKNFLICLDRTMVRLVVIVDTELITNQTTSLESWLWSCEKASCLEVCPKERLIFIGTTHKLLILKMVPQGIEKQLDFQQIITFTHNLKHYPTMLRFGLDSLQNYHVWVSSHLSGDTKLCSFAKVPPKRFATKHLPLKPLTVLESNHLARTKGKCIYPAAVLKRRVELFHSGIAFIIDSNNFHMLLQNSIGDIFYQRIIQDPNESNAQQIPTLFHSWMLQLNSINISQPGTATDFKNLRGFKRIFTCSNHRQTENPEPPAADGAFRRRPRWQQTVEQLHEYRDLLASDMLSIWGFRPDVTGAKRRLSQDVPINVTERISHWLDENTEDEPYLEPYDEIVKEEPVVQLNSDPETDPEEKVEIVEAPNVCPVPKSLPCDAVTAVGTEILSGVNVETPRIAVRPGRKKYVQGF